MNINTLIFDFETTGLTLHPRADLNKQPRAIEFGGALLCNDQVTETFSILINPEEPLDPVITKITGLTDADLKDAPTFKQVLPQIERILSNVHQLIAHNLPFDMQVMQHELSRAKAFHVKLPERRRCTVQEFADEFGRRMKLTELYERVMGKPLAQTHRALDDVNALTEIVIKEGIWR